MDTQVYTSATKHLHQPGACPECGQTHQVKWIYDGRLFKRDRYLPEEKCSNPGCLRFESHLTSDISDPAG